MNKSYLFLLLCFAYSPATFAAGDLNAELKCHRALSAMVPMSSRSFGDDHYLMVSKSKEWTSGFFLYTPKMAYSCELPAPRQEDGTLTKYQFHIRDMNGRITPYYYTFKKDKLDPESIMSIEANQSSTNDSEFRAIICKEHLDLESRNALNAELENSISSVKKYFDLLETAAKKYGDKGPLAPKTEDYTEVLKTCIKAPGVADIAGQELDKLKPSRHPRRVEKSNTK